MEGRGGHEVPHLAEELLAAAGNAAPVFLKDFGSQPLLQDMALYTGTRRQSKVTQWVYKK